MASFGIQIQGWQGRWTAIKGINRIEKQDLLILDDFGTQPV
jgi:hypothetical protein